MATLFFWRSANPVPPSSPIDSPTPRMRWRSARTACRGSSRNGSPGRRARKVRRSPDPICPAFGYSIQTSTVLCSASSSTWTSSPSAPESIMAVTADQSMSTSLILGEKAWAICMPHLTTWIGILTLTAGRPPFASTTLTRKYLAFTSDACVSLCCTTATWDHLRSQGPTREPQSIRGDRPIEHGPSGLARQQGLHLPGDEAHRQPRRQPVQSVHQPGASGTGDNQDCASNLHRRVTCSGDRQPRSGESGMAHGRQRNADPIGEKGILWDNLNDQRAGLAFWWEQAAQRLPDR